LGITELTLDNFLYKDEKGANYTFNTKYHHWSDEYRPYLLENLKYIQVEEMDYPNSIPK